MQEPFWNMLANGDSPFYTSLRGNGFVKWESGCFVNFDMSALKYEELLLLSFFDEGLRNMSLMLYLNVMSLFLRHLTLIMERNRDDTR